jgi:C-terminal processing protease CtpA/Prc
MEKARDSRDYALALAEMAARTYDTHTTVSGHPELTRLYGEAPAPVVIRWIEGAWAIVGLRDDPETRAAGVAVGDIVLAVDGEPVTSREAFLSPYLPASNQDALRRRLGERLLAGPAGSTATLLVRGRDGQNRKVELRRGAWTWEPPGEVVRLLPGNLGYVDLTRLTVAEVDAMFERLKETRGIIFDMRGYPKGTAWSIAPRLNTNGARGAAQFRRNLVTGASTGETLQFVQDLPLAEGPIYRGKTVMLIDERAISQSEHTGLFFEAANGTEFIGTPTSGANGDVTYFPVPGGITVRFAAHDVRHADGRQLQRIGLVPDVLVAPTLQGIRDGRDEVLERAERYLTEETSR